MFLCAIYDRMDNCYLNIEVHEHEIYALCMKLGYEYLAFFRDFMILD